MADAVFVIHAPDTAMEAAILSASLNQAGIFAITYHQAVGTSIHSEVEENWLDIASYIPIFIVLGSSMLFEDQFLSEKAHDVLAAKKAICVYSGDSLNLPTWFLSGSINISFGDERAWNKLVQALQKFVAILPDLHPRIRPS